ncbi:MAG: Mrp/NBP35 family ATP-binding protein, partial [Calditrichaeota bacterium]|nr:Mrp/NBP35 family ATP-binding protein [Calditrichota bacterium]
MKIEKADIINVLKTYKHPAYPSDLITANMISVIKINDNVVILEIYTPNRESEHRADLKQGVSNFLSTRGLTVQAVFFTEQKPSATALSDHPFDDQKKIAGINKIIAVASGKGGVGKSTVSSNLAVSLARAGYRVGLMDADIYGPSMAMMMGVSDAKPTTPDGKKINPIESHGIKVMSMAFLTTPNQAVIWRGPMLMKAVNQFLNDVLWGTLDYLIVDLPPGTGDVQLTLTQETPLAGAVIVTTPQDVALLDVTRCVKMFERVNVPVI